MQFLGGDLYYIIIVYWSNCMLPKPINGLINCCWRKRSFSTSPMVVLALPTDDSSFCTGQTAHLIFRISHTAIHHYKYFKTVHKSLAHQPYCIHHYIFSLFHVCPRAVYTIGLKLSELHLHTINIQVDISGSMQKFSILWYDEFSVIWQIFKCQCYTVSPQ